MASTQGEAEIATYRSSAQSTRGFCRTRGSQVHYYDSRAAWTQVNDDLPKLGGEDGMRPS